MRTAWAFSHADPELLSFPAKNPLRVGQAAHARLHPSRAVNSDQPPSGGMDVRIIRQVLGVWDGGGQNRPKSNAQAIEFVRYEPENACPESADSVIDFSGVETSARCAGSPFRHASHATFPACRRGRTSSCGFFLKRTGSLPSQGTHLQGRRFQCVEVVE